MDHRTKSFPSMALDAFAFLNDLGFFSSTEVPDDTNRRPLAITARFHRSDVEVETALVLEPGGEDAVCTIVRSTAVGEQALSPRVARKGHEMTKALRAHSAEVQALLAARS